MYYLQKVFGANWNDVWASKCYNQSQKYLRHCTLFWHKWPVHDLVLVIPPPALIKVASNTRPYSKLRGTTLNGREEGGQYYILQTCDQERFEARKVVFPCECLIIFATGCSFSLPKWQAVKMIFFTPCLTYLEKDPVPARRCSLCISFSICFCSFFFFASTIKLTWK